MASSSFGLAYRWALTAKINTVACATVYGDPPEIHLGA